MSEHEREAKPSPLSTPSARAAPDSSRAAPFPSSLVLDEQIVNSSRIVSLVTPALKGGPPGKAIVSIKPATSLVSRRNDLEKAADDLASRKAEAFSPTAPTHELATGVDIPIRFWPKFSGTHEADVSILMRWPDEQVELRTIRVYGPARKLDEAPERPLGEVRRPGGSAKEEKEVLVADRSRIPHNEVSELDTLKGEAVVFAGQLANRHRDGIHEASAEAAYERRPPEAPWWESLAEFALSLTIAGVAAGLSKKIAGSLSLSKYSEIGFADSVKEAMKAGGKRAFLNRAGAPEADVSSDTKIAFFTTQFRTVSMLEKENAELVHRAYRRLTHAQLSDSGRAIAEMRALRDGLEGMHPFAHEEQAKQTRLQWLSLLGRAVNGTDFVKVNGELRQTTDLSHATPATRGILRIRVQEGKVTKASMDGVSQATADRLLGQRLLREPIPVLIEYNNGRNGSFYTRDEVGRVRTSFHPEGEADDHHEVQQKVDAVLSRSLREWGVARIETDDAKKEIGQ